MAAPERTDTSSGSSGSPKRLPVRSSRAPRWRSTSSSSPSGSCLPFMYARHASVVIVKPAGTGTPSCVISASPMPLPPSSSLPPSEGSSKSYTNRVMSADSQSRQIVGMGGFPSDALWNHVLSLAGGRRVLVDHAADPAFLEEPALDGELTDLSFYPWPPENLRELALAHDVILVCGGNTANMLAIWRVHGFDGILREAWESGVLLTGWSAGMICWFEAGVTDSFGAQLEGMPDGLGFLPGSACPHYDGEERRRPVYTALVRGGFPAGIAIDGEAGALYVGTELQGVVTDRAQAGGYCVGADGEESLAVRRLTW